MSLETRDGGGGGYERIKLGKFVCVPRPRRNRTYNIDINHCIRNNDSENNKIIVLL